MGLTCWLSCAEAGAGVLAKPVPETRGHTGYLTFARRLVDEGGAAAPALNLKTGDPILARRLVDEGGGAPPAPAAVPGGDAVGA